MKDKLYYQDAYMQEFTSKIIKQDQDDSGKWYVVLKETAFYPTGGGQPHDTGTLNGIPVENVEALEGEIRHFIQGPLKDANGDVAGRIDWERRFDHMQQHSGQHILSAAFESLFDFKTVSFHLGQEFLTIDLDVEELTEEHAWKAEDLANQIILENRPIETKWISADELANYPLRKKIAVSDNIRLVIIPEFDYNGCGGTHPSATGQVASLKILDWEKQKKKIRLRFVCGNRVRKQLFQKHKILTELSPLLNAPEEGMSESVQRLLQNVKSLEKELESSKEELLKHEAIGLVNQSQNSLVSKVFRDRSMQELQKLARTIIPFNEKLNVILVSETDNKLQIVCARGNGSIINMKEIAASVFPLINGKGGGNDSFAQGGGEAAMSGEELLQVLIGKIVL